MAKPTKKLSLKDLKEIADYSNLDLSLSSISDAPFKTIAQLKNLTELDLSNNLIRKLSPDIGLLVNIVHLDMSKNHIEVLPPEIGKLTSLRHLDLYENKLDHLPLELGNLKKLRYLDLKGNPLKSGLQTIVGQCLSVKECQTAAKRVVPFLADMALQIKEDLVRMKQKQKELAAIRKVFEEKEAETGFPQKTMLRAELDLRLEEAKRQTKRKRKLAAAAAELQIAESKRIEVQRSTTKGWFHGFGKAALVLLLGVVVFLIFIGPLEKTQLDFLKNLI